MPHLGDTAHHRVSSLLAAKRADLLARCPGATSAHIEPGFGSVWQGVNGGAYQVVHTDDDYRFVIVVDNAKRVPTEPTFYNGVPVRYQVHAN